MAKLYNNDKGFLVVVMNHEEALKCNFGVIEDGHHIVIDDNTNEPIYDAIYYVCVLNMCFNKSSFIGWLNDSHTKRYDEDIRYEQRHLDYVESKITVL